MADIKFQNLNMGDFSVILNNSSSGNQNAKYQHSITHDSILLLATLGCQQNDKLRSGSKSTLNSVRID